MHTTICQNLDNRHTAWYSQVSCAAVECGKLKHRCGQTHKLCVKTQFGTSCSAQLCSVPWSAGRNQGVTAIYHIHPPMNTHCSLNVVPRFSQISCLHFANSHSHPTNIRANLQQFKLQTAERYCCSVWEVLPLKIAFQQVPKGHKSVRKLYFYVCLSICVFVLIFVCLHLCV